MPLPNTQLDYLRRVASNARRTLVDHTPLLDTGAYAVGDILFVTPGPIIATTGGDTSELSSVCVTSGAVTAVALNIFLFDRAVALPAANAAFTLTDADMKFCQGCISIATGDWVVGETGSNAVATKSSLDIHVRPFANGTMYYAVKINTVATYAADGLTFKFGFQN